MTPFQYLVVALAAYLIGSFSSGIVLAAIKGRDIRKEGSKSSGATNVTRVMGLGYGLLTFLGDFIKASLAVWVGVLICGYPGAMVAGIYAVAGHNWPVYYQFRGGKGIVCSVAVLIWMSPVEALVASALAVLVIALTRFVSLGSLTMVGVSTLLILIFKPFVPLGAWALILLLLAVYQHRTNIMRLLRGEENKLDLKKKPPVKPS